MKVKVCLEIIADMDFLDDGESEYIQEVNGPMSEIDVHASIENYMDADEESFLEELLSNSILILLTNAGKAK